MRLNTYLIYKVYICSLCEKVVRYRKLSFKCSAINFFLKRTVIIKNVYETSVVIVQEKFLSMSKLADDNLLVAYPFFWEKISFEKFEITISRQVFSVRLIVRGVLSFLKISFV